MSQHQPHTFSFSKAVVIAHVCVDYNIHHDGIESPEEPEYAVVVYPDGSVHLYKNVSEPDDERTEWEEVINALKAMVSLARTQEECVRRGTAALRAVTEAVRKADAEHP